MNWVLIVVLAILISSTILGMKKGLVRMLFSLFSIVITIVLVAIFAPVLSGFLKENTKIYSKVEATVGEKIVTEKIFNNIADKDSVIDSLNLPEVIKNYLKESDAADDVLAEGTTAVREWMIDKISGIFFTAGVFVVSFIIVFIALRIVMGLLDVITKLPIIHMTNVWAGGALGFVIALLGIWFILCILTMFGSSGLSKIVFEQINADPVLTFISDHNLLLQYIQAIIK